MSFDIFVGHINTLYHRLNGQVLGVYLHGPTAMFRSQPYHPFNLRDSHHLTHIWTKDSHDIAWFHIVLVDSKNNKRAMSKSFLFWQSRHKIPFHVIKLSVAQLDGFSCHNCGPPSSCTWGQKWCRSVVPFTKIYSFPSIILPPQQKLIAAIAFSFPISTKTS